MALRICTATTEDYSAICTIVDEADRLHRDAAPHVFQQPQGPVREREYIEGLLADRGHYLLVAEEEGRLLGFLHAAAQSSRPIPIMRPRRYVVVENLAVRGDSRRRGIGTALLRRVEALATELGMDGVELTVWEFNQSALAFYRSLGYATATRRLWMYPAP